jgi:uncharacterized protein (TIGR02996 family)
MDLQDETFIQAILEHPEEDANWLVYADWLEERDDPRAAHYRQRQLTNSIGMQFVLVPRGTFWMGGEGGKPGDKQVEMAYEFYLGIYPVTQAEWQVLMGSNPSYFSRTGHGKGKVKKIADADLKQFPVEQVSWDDAQEFIQKVNEQEKGRSGWLYRLPTEEEWEYACRGGARSEEDCSFDFYLDHPTNDLSSTQANFNGNHPAGGAAKGPYLQRTTKVGSYPPNRIGIHDLHGNVWEWTDSVVGSDRVYRGGGWINLGSRCRAAYRNGNTPTGRSERRRRPLSRSEGQSGRERGRRSCALESRGFAPGAHVSVLNGCTNSIMAFQLFTVPIQDDGRALEQLNAFLRSHKILSVDRRWVEQGASSFWSFCIDYLEGAPADGSGYRGSRGPGGRAKIDYRETLSPADFAVFARLRDLRKDIAQAEGVPVYTIFTNEQLAQMVQTRTTTKAALEKIAGVGDARLDKYGGRLLELLGQAWKDSHEADGKPV